MDRSRIISSTPPPPPKKIYISSISVSKIYWPMGIPSWQPAFKVYLQPSINRNCSFEKSFWRQESIHTPRCTLLPLNWQDCVVVNLTPPPKPLPCQSIFDYNDLNGRVLSRMWKPIRGMCIFHIIAEQSLSLIVRPIYKDTNPTPGPVQFFNNNGNCSLGWLFLEGERGGQC